MDVVDKDSLSYLPETASLELHIEELKKEREHLQGKLKDAELRLKIALESHDRLLDKVLNLRIK